MESLLFILRFFIAVPAIITAITLHGFVRAAVSAALGDAHPKNAKRLSLNPLKHFEPVGFLCMFFFGLGWGKPVETRPFGYKRPRKQAELIVAVAPLAANTLFAVLCAIFARVIEGTVNMDIMSNFVGWQRIVYDLLRAGAMYNLCFAIFHLIPIYPLDGARILAVLKPAWAQNIRTRQNAAQIIMMLLLCFNLLSSVIQPLAAGILGFRYV